MHWRSDGPGSNQVSFIVDFMIFAALPRGRGAGRELYIAPGGTAAPGMYQCPLQGYAALVDEGEGGLTGIESDGSGSGSGSGSGWGQCPLVTLNHPLMQSWASFRRLRNPGWHPSLSSIHDTFIISFYLSYSFYSSAFC